MIYLEKFSLFKKEKQELEYNLESYGGESIGDFIDRLLEHYNLVKSNKLALYASMVNSKNSVVTGEFNGIVLYVRANSTKDNLLEQYKNKLKK